MDDLLKYVMLAVLLVNFADVNAQSLNITCENGKYPPDPSQKVKNYVVNLDLPADQRWKEVATEKGEGIRNLITAFKKFITDWGTLGEVLISFIDREGDKLDDTLPAPFRDEIRSMANYTGVKLGEMLLYNLFYEFFTVCTSIVAEDPAGNLYHARNLDFGLFLGWDIRNKSWEITEFLRPIIVNLDWQKGGKTVYKSVNFAGYVGILTAVKPHVFTMSMDERFNKDGGFIGIYKWIMGDRKERWMGFLTRDVMENATSYSEAVTMLNNTVMLAPAYFIVGGNRSGEACVITRARQTSLDQWLMAKAGGWYILETNYDHWEAPLFLDDRRTPANMCMRKMGQKRVGFPGIFDVLSTQPVLNKLTTYTALMKVGTGELESYLRYCKDPCYPW